jgi:hypothetical protein
MTIDFKINILIQVRAAKSDALRAQKHGGFGEKHTTKKFKGLTFLPKWFKLVSTKWEIVLR